MCWRCVLLCAGDVCNDAFEGGNVWWLMHQVLTQNLQAAADAAASK
jgi:hypothetical protein